MRVVWFQIGVFYFFTASLLFGADRVVLPNLPVLDKSAPELASFNGRPLVVVFWAVWCGPCAKELKELEAFQKSEKVAFVGIAVDSNERQAVRMVQKTGISFANYLDANSTFAEALGVTGVPSLIVVDSQGNVVSAQSGYSTFPEQELRKQIKKIIE